MDLDPSQVTGLVDKWRDRLGIMPEWTIGVKVVKDEKEVNEDDREDYAYTSINEAYFEADITFHQWRFQGRDLEFLDLVVCHEVLHIVLHKMEELVETALGKNTGLALILTENAVETISRAMTRLQNKCCG